MAAKSSDTSRQVEQILSQISQGRFSPVYLLMGEEPYYPDLVCRTLLDRVIPSEQKDFNEFIYYGLQSSVSDIVATARRYPVFYDRQLVVVKEAQSLSRLDDLAEYVSKPMESTVFVICMMGKKADARKGLYKAAQKSGAVIVCSDPIRDYETSAWIKKYFSDRGYSINEEAAELFSYCMGPDLMKIASRSDKLIANLPQERKTVGVEDVETNVGVDRRFSSFEFVKLLGARKNAQALKVAEYMGASAKFSMVECVSVVYSYFDKALRLALLRKENPSVDSGTITQTTGIAPYFIREYDTVCRLYGVNSLVRIISILLDFDFKAKGGNGEATDPKSLLTEMTVKILCS